ncbi:hypothetical protein M9H77_11547 [Catharanthus roseus]|uniref:Uncharacterized protein n=1 Tax=Catharanthus roseus TaxID=4058 RepID=A0ACC0BF26_CATRO|nr:hypothetical protein M9H77_11547 [Catharanthus roseus]
MAQPDGRLVESQEGPETEVGPRADLISSEGSGAQQATEVLGQEFLDQISSEGHMAVLYCGTYNLVPRGTQMPYSAAIDLVVGLGALHYQYKNGASLVYDGLIFVNSQTDDNIVSKKRKVQILEILCKPYDKEEHERLMQEITKRKPQHKHRDLRSGGVKFYPSVKMGKSLLDHHLVLKRKIEEAVAANNDLKQLKLLRGFFIWLQWKCKTLRKRYAHSKSRERLRKGTTHETRCL